MAEKMLLDYGGSRNEGVKFEVKEDHSGINLHGFNLDGVEQIVEETLQYRPWNFGYINPGAGQVGIYRIRDPNDQRKVALIKDYRAVEGDWRVTLVDVKPTEQDLISALKDSAYSTSFQDYLF